MNLVRFPNKVLAEPTKNVEAFDEGLRSFAEQLTWVMYGKPVEGKSDDPIGVGLAAPQVGDSRRIIVVESAHMFSSAREPLVLVNPRLTFQSPEMCVDVEGCLSLPGVELSIARSKFVVVEYQDVEGNVHSREAANFFARVIQHEIDHLDGITMLDKVNRKLRKIALKRLK